MALQTSLFDIDNWREIGATLARNKTRTFLTAFGIFWGVLMLALLWGGANGLKGMLMRNFSTIASTNLGAIFTETTTMPYRGFNKGRRWNLEQADVDNFRASIPELQYITGVYQSWGNMIAGSKSYSGRVMGGEPDYFRIVVPALHAGRTINASDIASRRKVVVLGSKIADELFPGESYDTLIGRSVSLRGIWYTIVGIASQIGDASIGGRLDESAIIPLSTMRQVEQGAGDRVDFVVFTVNAPAMVKDILPTIYRKAMLAHNVNPADSAAISSMDLSEMFEMVNNVFLGVTILALFVGIGSLMAGIIGIGNIMWIIVKERTHEIGIRRAIGARPSSIIIQILSESMVLTTIAGLAGIVVSTLILYVVDLGSADPILGSAGFTLSFRNSLIVLFLFMILGTAAGVIPAVKAMRIKPIEAINDK